jgi:Transcriptional regulator
MKSNDERIDARILVCAEDLLFQKGLQGWNMDQLASQAGLAKRTLYKIVGTKEKLIERIVMNKIFEIQHKLQNIVESEKDFFVALDEFICTYPNILGLASGKLGEIYLEYPAIEEQVICRRRELADYLYNFIQSGKDTGKIRQDVDVEILIQALQAILLHFIKHERDSTAFRNRLTIAMQYIFHGIRN